MVMLRILITDENIEEIENAIHGYLDGSIDKAEFFRKTVQKCKNCDSYRSTGVDVRGQDGNCLRKGFRSVLNEDVIAGHCSAIKDFQEEC